MSESRELIDQFEGNWEVVYLDAHQKEVYRAYLPLHKTWQLTRNELAGADAANMNYSIGVIQGFRRVDDSPWVIQGHGAEPKISAEGVLKIGHPYGFLGYWGGTSTVQPAGLNVIRGEWKYGDTGGTEIWHRMHPRITEIEYSSSITSHVAADGPPGRMKTTYSGPGNDMRGNRAGFEIKVYGDNLWGPHICNIADMDLEVASYYPIISPTPTGRPQNVIGLLLRGNFWSKASPGRKWVHVDNMKFPFDLEVTGYPAPATALRFVRLVAGHFEAAPDLNHGDEFYVEASYKAAPLHPPGPVRVSWNDNEPHEVALAVTSDSKLFRSGPLRVEPPAK